MTTLNALFAMEYQLLGLELDDVLEGGPAPPEYVAVREELELVPPLDRPHRPGTLFADRLSSTETASVVRVAVSSVRVGGDVLRRRSSTSTTSRRSVDVSRRHGRN